MCQFLSALVVRNGDVLTHPMLVSHTDLVQYYRLPDTQLYHQHFVKVELVPDDWLDVSTWAFRLDEDTAPGWWKEVSAGAEEHLRRVAAKMVLRDGEHWLILDGAWIIGGTAIVHDVRGGRILQVQDSAQIRDVWGSAQIYGVRDSAQIRDVRDFAQIHGVRGSAQIYGVGGSAQIYGVRGSAQIHDVGGSAQIHDVRGSAQIHGVWGSAQIHGVEDNVQIRDVRDSAILDQTARAHVVA